MLAARRETVMSLRAAPDNYAVMLNYLMHNNHCIIKSAAWLHCMIKSAAWLQHSQEHPDLHKADLRVAWAAGALGSPGFISPEIIIGGVHTYAMDVFAVGVVLFVLLVGRKPFNIADSQSLDYCHMKLADCPGMQDPR